MKYVFSYCIYGNQLKYTEGLLRNIQQIQELYPEFEIWITVGNDTPEDYIIKYSEFANVHMFFSDDTGGRLMAHRFFAIDDPDVELMIVRDADSRFTERDQVCIDYFIQSDYSIFTIRDHSYHTQTIMGGQWGMRKIDNLIIEEKYKEFCETCPNIDAYSSDQVFLHNYIYKFYKDSLVVYSSTHRYPDEYCEDIDIRRKNDYDFCGNVILFRKNAQNKLEEYPEFTIHGHI